METKNSLEQNRQDMLSKAKGEALKLISFSARSVEELRRRLELKRYPADIITDVIESFRKQGLLDDEKYARLFASARVYGRPAGKRQIELELKRKGLSESVVQKTLEGMKDYDEKKAARDLVSKRFERMTGVSSEKRKSRLFGFLKRRGFGSDVIFSVMDDLLKGERPPSGEP